jgi:hypothetical protein
MDNDNYAASVTTITMLLASVAPAYLGCTSNATTYSDQLSEATAIVRWARRYFASFSLLKGFLPFYSLILSFFITFYFLFQRNNFFDPDCRLV